MPPDTNLEKLIASIAMLLHGTSQPTDTQRILIECFIYQQGLNNILLP